MTDEELAAVIERARGENRAPRVLVTGSREWADIEPIRRELARLPPDTIVIHPACPSRSSAADRCRSPFRFSLR